MPTLRNTLPSQESISMCQRPFFLWTLRPQEPTTHQEMSLLRQWRAFHTQFGFGKSERRTETSHVFKMQLLQRWLQTGASWLAFQYLSKKTHDSLSKLVYRLLYWQRHFRDHGEQPWLSLDFFTPSWSQAQNLGFERLFDWRQTSTIGGFSFHRKLFDFNLFF